MAHHDIRLPEEIERGARGGPRFSTGLVELISGYEQRNQNWQHYRAEFDISYGVRSKKDWVTIRDFFAARRGRAHTFRYKNWADYQIGRTATPQRIGTGDGSTAAFQIRKLYEPGPYEYLKPVYLIVSGTLQVYVNGVLQTVTTHYTVDNAGLITFVTPPPNTQVVAVICEFDFRTRFVSDKLDGLVFLDGADENSETGDFRVPSIPLIEVRGAG